MVKVFVISLVGVTLAVAQSDTTYGKYHAKSKTSTYQTSSQSSNQSESRKPSIIGGILRAIFSPDTLKNSTVHVSSTPTREPVVSYLSDRGPKRMFYGSTGFGGAYQWYDPIAEGGQFSMPFALQFVPESKVWATFSVAPTFGSYRMKADFERDVFVNGVNKGKQTFVTDEYKQFSMPMIASCNIALNQDKRFSFSIGAGPVFTHELVTENVASGLKGSTVRANNWSPQIDMGVIFLREFGSHWMSFAPHLSFTTHKNDGLVPTPVHNSSGSASIGANIQVWF